MYSPTQPYNDLPLFPPSLEALETRAVLKHAMKANRALAELKGQLGRIPNPRLLTQAITLQEARLSSEIENIVTTQDELFKASAELLPSVNSATKEVLRYNDAIWKGFERLQEGQPFSTRLFVALVQDIKGTFFDVRTLPGTTIANPDTRQVVYTPPEGEALLREKLANLEQFYHSPLLDIDPLIRMAVGHYQFEAIHPFSDGNGRTGRILNMLYLVDQGLLEWPVLYLSRYIIQHKNDYYAKLRGVTEQQAWEPWILYMIEGVLQTAVATLAQVKQIIALMHTFKERLQAEHPKLYSYELVEALFEQPYCKVPFLVQKGIAKRQTAATYLKTLSDIGLLEGIKVGREIYYINTQLIHILKS